MFKGLMPLFVIAALLGFALGTAPRASAHTNSNYGYTYWTPDSNCTYNEAKIYDYGTSGRVQSKQAIVVGAGTSACGGNLQVPGGYLQNKLVIFKNNGGFWALCTQTSVIFSGSPGFYLDQLTNGSPGICGAGEYSVQSNGYVLINSNWYGGGVQTSSHNF